MLLCETEPCCRRQRASPGRKYLVKLEYLRTILLCNLTPQKEWNKFRNLTPSPGAPTNIFTLSEVFILKIYLGAGLSPGLICYTFCMKKIGEGWQYGVYDIGNGRVLKKFHSLPKRYWAILKTIFPFKDDPFYKVPGYARSMRLKALESFSVLKDSKIPPEIVGNPTFVNQFDFEQDKVVPLHDYFNEISIEAGKKLIDDFVLFNKQLLNYGFIDKSFNIGKNFGINDGGEIVLIDIGELFSNKDRIQKQIENRAWAKHYVTDHIPKKLVRYFIKEMDKALNS